MKAPQRSTFQPAALVAATVACVAPLLSLSACGFVQRSFKSSTPPTISIASASLDPVPQGTNAARVVHIDLLAENPNPDDLPILNVRYVATLSDGTRQLRVVGERTGQATMGAFGAQRFSLPVPVPEDALGEPASFTIAGEVEYLRPAAIAKTLQENGLGGTTKSFAGEGAIAPAPATLTPPAGQ